MEPVTCAAYSMQLASATQLHQAGACNGYLCAGWIKNRRSLSYMIERRGYHADDKEDKSPFPSPLEAWEKS